MKQSIASFCSRISACAMMLGIGVLSILVIGEQKVWAQAGCTTNVVTVTTTVQCLSGAAVTYSNIIGTSNARFSAFNGNGTSYGQINITNSQTLSGSFFVDNGIVVLNSGVTLDVPTITVGNTSLGNGVVQSAPARLDLLGNLQLGGSNSTVAVNLTRGNNQNATLVLGQINGSGTSVDIGTLNGDGAVLIGTNGVLRVGFGNGNSTFTGIINASGLNNGHGTVEKVGTGTLIMGGATPSAYNNTIISGGLLAITGNASLGLGSLTLNGGRIDFQASNATTSTNLSSLLGGRSLLLSNVAGSGFEVSTNRTLVVDQTLSANGSGVQATGGITKTGNGILVFSVNQTYQGVTDLQGGTLTLAGNFLTQSSRVDIKNNSTLNLGGASVTLNAISLISGNILGGTLTSTSYDIQSGSVSANLGGGTINKTTTGTVSLGGQYSGSEINITQGEFGITANNRLSDNASVTINGADSIFNVSTFNDTIDTLNLTDGTVNGTGTLTAVNYNLNNGTVNAELGTGILTQIGGITTLNGFAGVGTINVNGGTLKIGSSNRIADNASLAISAGATFDQTDLNEAIGSLSGSGTLTLGATGSLIFGGATNTSFSGSQTGAGTLIKGGTGTFTLSGVSEAHHVTVNDGTLQLAAADRLSDNAELTINSGAIFRLQNFDETIQTLTLTDGILSGTGTLVAANYNLTNGTVNAHLGAGQLTKDNVGDVTLNGNVQANVTIFNGQLILGQSEILDDNADVDIFGGGAILNLGTSHDETIGHLTLQNGQILGDTSSTLSANVYDFFNAGDVFVNLGQGTLNKDGDGTLTLRGASQATGDVLNLFGGTLELVGVNNADTINLAGGVLRLAANDRLSNISDVALTNGSNFDLQGFNEIVDSLTLTDGDIDGTGTLVAAHYNLTNGTVNANLGGGILTQNFGGTTLLNGTADAVTTNITGGELRLGDDNRLVDSAVVTLTNGSVLNLQAFNDTIDSLTLTNGTINGSGILNAANYNLISGTINARLDGNNGLTKSGVGTVTLTGVNLYRGVTTITGGTLAVAASNNLGVDGIEFNGANTVLLLGNGFDDSLLPHNIALTSDGEINVGAGSAKLAGGISGLGGLVKSGSGHVALSGANNYGGETIINGGRLIANNDNALGSGAVTNNAELEISSGRHLNANSYDQTATGSLLFNVGSASDNTAIFHLTNSATFGAGGVLGVSFVGNDQTLYRDQTSWTLAEATGSLGDALALTQNFTFNGLAVSQLNGFSFDFANRDLGNGRFQLVLSLVRGLDNLQRDAAAFGVNGFYRRNFLLTNIDADINDPADTHTLSVADGDNAELDGVISDGNNPDGSSTGESLTKLGGGTLILSGVNTYTGGTIVAGGTLQGEVFNNSSSFGTGNITNNAALRINTSTGINGTFGQLINGTGSLTKSGDGTLILTRNNTYNGGTTISGGTLQGEIFANGSSFGTGAIVNNGALRINAGNGVNGVFGQAISGTGSVTMSGTGNLTLSAVNSYQGGTFLNGGRLNISGDDQLGDATGRLTFNGGSLRTTASLTSNRDVTLTQNGSFSILPQRNVIWNGAIDGAGQLIKDGSGDLSLTNGGNSYRGGVRINQGRLSVFADGNLGDAGNRVTLSGGTFRSSVNIASNRQGTLEGIGSFLVTPNRNATWNGVIDGAGQLLKLGTGTLTLTNSNTYRGGTRLMTGVVAVSRDDSLGDASGLVSFANGTLRAIGSFASNRHATIDGFGTFSVDGGQTLTWDGVIDGAGLLNKDGLGTLTLTNNNNLYQRPTRISAGTLRLGNVGASNVLPDNGAVNLGSGTSASILDVARARETIGALNVGPNGTVRVELVPDDTDSLSGRLNVTGNAAFAVGARLNIVPGQGGYLAGQSYNVLEAGNINTNGGDILTGAIASPFVGFQTQLVEGATDRLLVNVVTPGNIPAPTLYASVAQTSRQASVGAAIGGLAEEAQPSLNRASAPVATSSPSGTTSATPSTSATSSSAASAPSRTTTPSGSNNPALSARQADAQLVVGNINTLSTPEVRLAYDQIGGSSHYGVTQLQHQADNAFADLLQSRLNQVSNNDAVSYRGSNLAVSGEDFQPGEVSEQGWVKRYGYAEDADGSFNATGLKYQTQGEAYGADFRLSEHWQMGFAAGRNKLDGSDQEDSASIESYQSALYGKYSGNDGLYLQGAAGLTRQDVETHRSIQFGQLSRQANSDRTDYTALANLEIGKAFEWNWGPHASGDGGAATSAGLYNSQYNLTLTPHLGMNYSHQFLSNFREEDAGTLDLNIKRADQDRLQIVPGISAQLQVKGQGYSLTPYIDLSYAYGLVNNGGKIEGELGSSRFAIDGESEDPSYGLIRAGLAMDWEEGLLGLNTNLYLDYNGKAGQSETDHALTTGFGISW